VVLLSARFEGLHDVAHVLVEHIRHATGIVDVQVGSPREASATIEPGVRITLLHTTPQAAPRNDPASPVHDLRSPPLCLSALYLVTTSGAERGDPVAAHNALGHVMRLYHEVPVLRLPLSQQPDSQPGLVTEVGDGQLRVTQVALPLDQVAQIWLAQRQPLQPCAVFEVAPIQLIARQSSPPTPPRVDRGGGEQLPE
jgi:hypothetical protein